MPPKKRSSSPAPKSPAAAAQPTEASQRAFYKALFAKRIAKGVAFAVAIYAATASPYSPIDMQYASKFALLHTYGLGWMYVSWIIVYLTRLYSTYNANSVRAPTGLPRPDQHIYETEGGEAIKMVTSGDAGRFNRAQRAGFNMDEGLPIFLAGLLLQAFVFGPIAAMIAGLYFYACVLFTDKYTEGGNRGDGFRPRMHAEATSFGLVVVCAAKALLGPLLPY